MTPSLKEFDELTINWPCFLRWNVWLTVNAAEAIIFLMDAVHDQEKADLFRCDVPLRTWMTLYRTHRQWWSAIGSLIGIEWADQFRDEMVAADRSPSSGSVQEWEDMFSHELRMFITESQESINGDWASGIAAVDAAMPDEVACDDFFDKPEMQFLFRVILPCWIKHHIQPTLLLRRARLGDMHALCDLLVIDKVIVHDPGVAKVIQEASAARNPARLRRISKALESRSFGRFDRLTVKVGLASMISAMSHTLNHPLSATQIRTAFDLVARKHGGLIDTDLPKSPEAFAKAIQRQRSRWPMTGQKSRREVSG